jgi:scyllo-inositol 2-dehydrogenase (NADP+)
MTLRFLLVPVLAAMPLAAQEFKMAVIGLVHSHVWGHLPAIAKGHDVKLVGIAETNPELIAEAKKIAGADVAIFSDYKKMLEDAKPDLVWSFVPNNQHLEIVKACAPRGINVIFEKPLASTYKDALEVQKLARQHHIKVMTNYQMAWWASNYTARKQADSAVGQVWRLHGVVGHGGPGSKGVRSQYFFEWLTDPVKNGAGALMDFGCYNALWSLWYLGRPETVYAQTNQLRPETFPKVEDNSTMILHYKNAVGIFEGSWDLPRGYQDLEVFGREGSIYMQNGKVDLRKGSGRGKNGEGQSVAIDPLPPERAEPVAYMVNAMRNKKEIEGLTALDINVGVVEIIDAAKESVKSGRAVPLPLKK